MLLQQHQIQFPSPDGGDLDSNDPDDPNNPEVDVEMTDLEDRSSPLPEQRRGVSIEEIEDEGDGGQGVDKDAVWIEEYGGAGATFGDGEPQREEERRRQEMEGEAPWAPFASLSEWKFAKWMTKWGLTGDGVDELLNLDLVSALNDVLYTHITDRSHPSDPKRQAAFIPQQPLFSPKNRPAPQGS